MNVWQLGLRALDGNMSNGPLDRPYPEKESWEMTPEELYELETWYIIQIREGSTGYARQLLRSLLRRPS